MTGNKVAAVSSIYTVFHRNDRNPFKRHNLFALFVALVEDYLLGVNLIGCYSFPSLG